MADAEQHVASTDTAALSGAPYEALRALDVLGNQLRVRVRDGGGAVLPGLQLEQPVLRALVLRLAAAALEISLTGLMTTRCHGRN